MGLAPGTLQRYPGGTTSKPGGRRQRRPARLYGRVLRLVVDGMNVIGSRPDGWWRDRPAAARRLAAALGGLTGKPPGLSVIVVFDGKPLPDLPEGRTGELEVRYSRRPGRNAADDRIVEDLDADPAPQEVTVITSDRALAERVRLRGASVQGPSWLLEKLDHGRW